MAEIAAQAPERVSRAVLLDPAIVVDTATALAQAESYRPDTSFTSAAEAVEARLATGTYFSTPQEIWTRRNSTSSAATTGGIGGAFSRSP